eukprot:GGOE01003102.1.p1 GENE.GGOE01003102.1~~GGOE01003102.1.p1  ORF type:complete len:595 (+),score=114.78 GGOE01003102.1:69-1853(+)
MQFRRLPLLVFVTFCFYAVVQICTTQVNFQSHIVLNPRLRTQSRSERNGAQKHCHRCIKFGLDQVQMKNMIIMHWESGSESPTPNLQTSTTTQMISAAGLTAVAVAVLSFSRWFLQPTVESSASSMVSLDGSLDEGDGAEPTEVQQKMFESHLADQERGVPLRDKVALQSVMAFLRGAPPPAEDLTQDEQEGDAIADLKSPTPTSFGGTKVYVCSPVKPPKEEPEPPRFSEEYFRQMEEAKAAFEKKLAEGISDVSGQPGMEASSVSRDPEAAWIDEDDDEEFDQEDFNEECASLGIDDLEQKMKLLRQKISNWKEEFYLKHSRDPTREDVDSSEMASIFLRFKTVAQWLTLKRRRKREGLDSTRARAAAAAAAAAGAAAVAAAADEDEGPSAPHRRFLSIHGRDEVALQKLCVQTEKKCADLSMDLLLEFKQQLEGEILEYKRSIAVEEVSGRNVHDLPMLRLYLQYGIVKNCLAARKQDASTEDAAAAAEDPLYHERTEKINQVAKKLDEQCRRMTTKELLFRKGVLRGDILSWKQKFIEVHQRSPTEDDVFQLGMDSAFTEYGIVDALLEDRPTEDVSAEEPEGFSSPSGL